MELWTEEFYGLPHTCYSGSDLVGIPNKNLLFTSRRRYSILGLLREQHQRRKMNVEILVYHSPSLSHSLIITRTPFSNCFSLNLKLTSPPPKPSGRELWKLPRSFLGGKFSEDHFFSCLTQFTEGFHCSLYFSPQTYLDETDKSPRSIFLLSSDNYSFQISSRFCAVAENGYS